MKEREREKEDDERFKKKKKKERGAQLFALCASVARQGGE